MRLFEEGIVERVAVREWIIIIHLVDPSMPFGWNSVTIGTSDRKVVVVLDPSALIVVLH